MKTKTVPVKIKRLNKYALLPERGSEKAAGYDVFACIQNTIQIKPHTTEKIGTGLAIEVPEEYYVGIYARSGIATRENLRPANCTGVVDSDYRGEVTVPIHNDSDEPRFITPHEKIAQLILSPVYEWDIDETDELSITQRGTGGFGSTGK